MKNYAMVLYLFVFGSIVLGQEVIVNEMSQGSSGNAEWVELLVVENGVDLRGWELGDNDDGSWYSIVEFTDDEAWSNVSMGTIVTVYNSGDIDGQILAAGGEDTDFSDKIVIIPHDNSTYFTDTGGWPGSGVFSNSDRDDCAAVRNADDVIVHDMAVTHPDATVESPGSGMVKYYISNTAAGASNNANWTLAASSEGTPGEPNGGENTIWIDQHLPVELSAFSAKGLDSQVKLSWTTQSEMNNAGFIVLRSHEENGYYQILSSYSSNNDLIGQGSSNEMHVYGYVDQNVFNGISYFYKLQDIGSNGEIGEHGPVMAIPGVMEEQDGSLQKEINFRLYSAYPNPFNPSTKLRFSIPDFNGIRPQVTLEIYNIAGIKICSLLDQEMGITELYETVWEGINDNGQLVSNGIYFAVLRAGEYMGVQKLVLLK